MSSSSIILSRSFFICLHSKILNFHLEQFHYILSNFKPSAEINQPLLSCGCKTSSSRAVRYFQLHAECACGRPLHSSPSVQNTFLLLLKSEFEHVYYWVLALFLNSLLFPHFFLIDCCRDGSGSSTKFLEGGILSRGQEKFKVLISPFFNEIYFRSSQPLCVT